MAYIRCWVLLLSYNLFVECSLLQTCDLKTESILTKSMALNDHAILTNVADDENECAKLCLKLKMCKSFNFDLSTRECELNNATLKEGMQTRRGSSLVHSAISSWPSQVDPGCYNHPCGDDEVCVPGHLTGYVSTETTCHFSCFKMVRRCPIPSLGTDFSQPRTVGSIYEHTCDRGYVGGDSGLCLPTGEWNKTIDTTCTPIYGSSCDSPGDCADVTDSVCTNNMCQCTDQNKYDTEMVACLPKCEPEWILFEEQCYLFGMDELSYPDARALCTSKNSHLVQVDSTAESDFLVGKMSEITPAPQSGYWNDLFQVTVNTQERWRTSGDALNPSVATWNGGNPNDHGGSESCTIFGRSVSYRWLDYSCVNDVRTDSDIWDSYFPNNRAVCEKGQ